MFESTHRTNVVEIEEQSSTRAIFTAIQVDGVDDSTTHAAKKKTIRLD